MNCIYNARKRAYQIMTNWDYWTVALSIFEEKKPQDVNDLSRSSLK